MPNKILGRTGRGAVRRKNIFRGSLPERLVYCLKEIIKASFVV
jgi:hypothetical protein